MQQITIKAYEPVHYDRVAALWTRINRELAPPHLAAAFEEYIDGIVANELRQLHIIFSRDQDNAFWIIEDGKELAGCFGIEKVDQHTTELRRMYLDQHYRGKGIAQRMLQTAEAQAADFGFNKMTLSTAEIQSAAMTFYKKSGYQLVRSERADAMSNKTVGGGLNRFYFEKQLDVDVG